MTAVLAVALWAVARFCVMDELLVPAWTRYVFFLELPFLLGMTLRYLSVKLGRG